MSKRAKRQARGNERVSAPSTSASASISRRSVFARTAEAEFNPDYTYVIRDLKRIGILVASFFSVLIILAIILK